MSIGVPFLFDDRIAYMSTLSERIESLMKENPSFTQASIARACGIKQPSVSDWINGRTKRMRGEVLLKAAAYFGVNEKWLATGEGNKKNIDKVPIKDEELIRSIPLDGLSILKMGAISEIAELIKNMSDEEVPDAVLGFNASTYALKNRKRKKTVKRKESDFDKD